MISESQLKQYKEWGIRDALIPLQEGVKVPASKKFWSERNGKWEADYCWKRDPETKEFIHWSDEELLKAKRVGVNQEACSLIDVDCDTIEGSPFMSELPDTLTIGRKEPDGKKVVRKKLYYANGFIKPESFKDHNGKAVVEILSKTQSWCFGDERIILNDVKPTTLNQEQLNQVVRTVKKISVKKESIETGTAGAPRTARDVYLNGASHSCAIFEREQLKPGDRISGPAIVEQIDTSTLLFPDDEGQIDGFGNLVIRVGK